MLRRYTIGCQFYGEVNASISVVSYFDYFSMSDDTSSDVAETLLFFVLRTVESIIGHLSGVHVVSLLTIDDSSVAVVEILSLYSLRWLNSLVASLWHSFYFNVDH
jgi:hypothetical protein